MKKLLLIVLLGVVNLFIAGVVTLLIVGLRNISLEALPVYVVAWIISFIITLFLGEYL